MLKKLLLSAAIIATSQCSIAQTWVADSISMGANYENDVYYSLANGAVKTSNNQSWELAFQMTPQGPYGNVSIFANHAQAGVEVYSLGYKASTMFGTLTGNDTVGRTNASQRLYNTDTSWNYGAFNRRLNGNIFNYGWGVYDQSSHSVVGDSLYLVKTPTAAYKVWVMRYVSFPSDSIRWEVRIANFDGTNDQEYKLYRKPNYTDDLFAYFDLDTRMAADLEPSRSAWDFVFTRYVEVIPGAPGNAPYPVAGALSNFGTMVAAVKGVDDDTAQRQNYPMSKSLKAIGSDWKMFMNPSGPWVLDTSATYFIKSSTSNQYWQLSFTGFTSSTRTMAFRKRSLSPTSVANITAGVASYKLFPNPSTATANLVIEATKQSIGQVSITNMTGQVVMQKSLQLQNGINAFSINTSNYPAGTYMVSISANGWAATQQLVVIH